MKKENNNLFTKITSFFWFGKKKDQEKPSLMLRRLLELGKKASGLPLEFPRKAFSQFQAPLCFLASPKTPTSQRLFNDCHLSGLRLVSVKKLRFLSRPKEEFFTSDPPAGGEFEKLGERSEILAGGSWPAVLAPPLLPKVEGKYCGKGDKKYQDSSSQTRNLAEPAIISLPRKSSIAPGTFSSQSICRGIFSSFQHFGGIMQSSLDVPTSKLGVISGPDNFFGWYTSFKKLKNQVDHDASPFKDGLPVADSRIDDDVVAYSNLMVGFNSFWSRSHVGNTLANLGFLVK